MLEGKGRVWRKHKTHGEYYVYIPREVSLDSKFPFKHGDRVKIRILPWMKGLEIRLEEGEADVSKSDS